MVAHRVLGFAAAFALLVSGCAGIHNDPVNVPLQPGQTMAADIGRDTPSFSDEMLIGLAFSGGGTRAAAFSFGVLQEIDRTRVPTRGGAGSLLDRVDFVSGVSGGSVLAAYYGLKKRAALDDFRERFLLRNAEEDLTTSIGPGVLVKALSGGVNDSNGLPRWLDQNLFNGATFAQLRENRRPRVWINASDIYNRTTFVFGHTAFAAMCSDLDAYPLSTAVAASAAVPVLFAPIVIQTFPQQCGLKPPAWIERARTNPSSPPMLRSFADAMASYRDGSVRYIKLLDGGLVDNYGLSGFTIGRLSSDTPYGPLTPQQAVKLRRAIFIVVDAGRAPSGNWVQTVQGPGGTELVMAAADTATEASMVAGYTAFQATAAEFEGSLKRWRCSLSAGERSRYGVPPGWSCSDVRFYVDRIAFDQLGAQRQAALNAVPTRFHLPAEQVDLVVSAGADAMRGSTVFRQFLSGMGGGMAPRRPAPPPPARPQPPSRSPSTPVAGMQSIEVAAQ